MTIEVCDTLNLAALLPVSDSPVKHNFVEVLDSVYSSRPDLWDQPWASVDWELYMDGSSFINSQGKRCARYAVETLDDVVEAKSLPQGTSAQKAELIALTWAPELSEGKIVNICTHSQYAFLTLQVHGALYKEKGLLNSGGKDIKYQQEIRQCRNHKGWQSCIAGDTSEFPPQWAKETPEQTQRHEKHHLLLIGHQSQTHYSLKCLGRCQLILKRKKIFFRQKEDKQ